MNFSSETWIRNLLSAMSVIDDLPIDERRRITIRRACAEALVEAEDREMHDFEHRNAGKPWTKQDMEILSTAVEGLGPCDSFGAEGMVLEMLSQRIGKGEKAIKKKAIEMGHGGKVDFWINRK